MRANAAAGRMLASARFPLGAAAGLLAVGAVLLGLTGSAWAQAFPRTLDEIKIYGKGETIEFVFSGPYDGTPVEEHHAGWASLNFGATGSKLPVRDLRPRGESDYKQIKVVQNQFSTTVTLVFKNKTFSLKNRLHYTHAGNLLTVDVGRPGSATAPAAQVLRQPENQLLAEMEQKIAGVAPSAARPPAPAPLASTAAEHPAAPAEPLFAKPAAPSALAPDRPAPKATVTATGLVQGGMSESDFFVTLATMIGAVAAIVIALYGALYLYKRFLADRLSRFAGGVAFKQIASFAVGPRQRIVILEINGETIACGVTPSQITFLTRLSGGAPQGTRRAPAAADAASDMPASITGLPAAGPAADAAGTEPAKPDPVHQFAELLKQKVRSLKRIN